ncbi:unnamed protein product [Arabis nemorensis]|uniref:Uncharacterized protein n=1 Tax=Arabis nemorensis TaxID=586526 RepID=A0A565C3L2_9BRAS|nr:unnamed protein product [Arabis nemorensis]
MQNESGALNVENGALNENELVIENENLVAEVGNANDNIGAKNIENLVAPLIVSPIENEVGNPNDIGTKNMFKNALDVYYAAKEGLAPNRIRRMKSSRNLVTNEGIVEEAWEIVNDAFLDTRSHSWTRETWQMSTNVKVSHAISEVPWPIKLWPRCKTAMENVKIDATKLTLESKWMEMTRKNSRNE